MRGALPLGLPLLWGGGQNPLLIQSETLLLPQLERPPGLWDLSCKRNVCNKFSLRAGSAVILVKEKEMLSVCVCVCVCVFKCLTKLA